MLVLIQPDGERARSCASWMRTASWEILAKRSSTQEGRGSRVVRGSSWMDASSGGDCEPELPGRLFLTAHEGPVQARISVTYSVTASTSPASSGAITLEGN